MADKILEERSQFVVKANDIIRKARFNMTLTQQKVYLYLISKIKPEDNGNTPYVFRIGDFLKVCDLDQSGANYQYIRDSILEISKVRFWIEGEKKTMLRGLLDKVDINHGEGTIECYFHDDVKPYLMYLRDNYTQFELKNVLNLRSKYSVRLYELMKSYQHVRYVQITLEQLRDGISAEGYTAYKDFKKRLLTPAINEVNALTDINITYTESRTGHKVTSFQFHITPKTSEEIWLAEKERERTHGKNTETDRG